MLLFFPSVFCGLRKLKKLFYHINTILPQPVMHRVPIPNYNLTFSKPAITDSHGCILMASRILHTTLERQVGQIMVILSKIIHLFTVPGTSSHPERLLPGLLKEGNFTGVAMPCSTSGTAALWKDVTHWSCQSVLFAAPCLIFSTFWVSRPPQEQYGNDHRSLSMTRVPWYRAVNQQSILRQLHSTALTRGGKAQHRELLEPSTPMAVVVGPQGVLRPGPFLGYYVRLGSLSVNK